LKVLGVIPARYASQRFPGKSLAEIAGKTMIRRVYERALTSTTLDRLIVATDDQRIQQHCRSFGAEVLMTGADCKNGTERAAAALRQLQESFDLVINIQGDEPLLHAPQLDQLTALLTDPTFEIATLASALAPDEIDNPNVVKVALSDELPTGGSIALGFSRDHAFISQASERVLKHIGLYAFRTECLLRVVALQPTPNELLEKLEQLRWLDHGYRIATGVTREANYSVDVPEDIDKILAVLKVNREI
jgi:3-deoxy-manno-octulosonate cytidylyltransferase (CMP-KDO synthetase)